MAKSILDYLEKREKSPEFDFEGKTYKIKKDYKITLLLAESQKTLDREDATASFKLIETFFVEAVGKDFLDAVKKADLSETEILFLFNFIQNRRSGMNEEDAVKEALKDDDSKKN